MPSTRCPQFMRYARNSAVKRKLFFSSHRKVHEHCWKLLNSSVFTFVVSLSIASYVALYARLQPSAYPFSLAIFGYPDVSLKTLRFQRARSGSSCEHNRGERFAFSPGHHDYVVQEPLCLLTEGAHSFTYIQRQLGLQSSHLEAQ